METEDEKIQRLVKEGIITAKADEVWENKKRKGLSEVSWGVLITQIVFISIIGIGGMSILRIDIITSIIVSVIFCLLLTIAFSLARNDTIKKYESSETLRIAEEHAKKQQKNGAVIFIILIFMAFVGFMYYASSTPYQQPQGNPQQGVEASTSSEIFAKAEVLREKCSGQADTTLFINNCQDFVDYLYANRAILDTLTTKNGQKWATFTIPIMERSINNAKLGQQPSSVTTTNSATTNSGTGTSDLSGTWVGSSEIGIKDGSSYRYTGKASMTFEQNGNNIKGSYTLDKTKSITGTVSSTQIDFTDGFRSFSGSFTTPNSLKINVESCLTKQQSIPDGYCVDPSNKDSRYQYEPGIKGVITLNRQRY